MPVPGPGDPSSDSSHSIVTQPAAGGFYDDSEVKDTSGNTIGKVEDIMLDKESSSIMYAVVGFGGFLGMGEKYHPVPWSQLCDTVSRDDEFEFAQIGLIRRKEHF